MKAAVDLHIHSALSACASDEMTPNNIVNMAILKGLDLIAVADHNSLGNYRSVSECARGKGLAVIPAIEAESIEGVHFICLFQNYEEALRFESIILNSLPYVKNREEIFGSQLLMDESDNVIKHIDQLLSVSSAISTDEITEYARTFGGLAIPAHIDRPSGGMLSNFGMIPPELGFNYLELSSNCNKEDIAKEYPFLKKFKLIQSSDAHNLGEILERVCFIDLPEKSAKGLIGTLSGS